MKICIAGKNDIACQVLRDLLEWRGTSADLFVVCTRDDQGKHSWQESLRFVAAASGVRELTLKEAQRIEGLIFLSVEFDRIVRPSRFHTDHLYNIHFSELPRHRGVATAIWPILEGDRTAGVTFHKIDAGIDTGAIIAQRVFELPETYTSRDLYCRCMAEGRALVVEQAKAIAGALPAALEGYVQDESCASYHARKDLDFGDLESFLEDTSESVSRYLRAFNFFEYQTPSIRGLRVIDFELTGEPSVHSPGTLIREDAHRSVLANTDGDVVLHHDPHPELYAWARGDAQLPESFDLRRVGDLDRTDARGWTALMVAAYAGNIEAATQLLTHGAQPNKTNKRGTTALMYARSGALRSGNRELVGLLIERGADLGLEDVHGRTIHWYLKRDGQHGLLSMIADR